MISSEESDGVFLVNTNVQLHLKCFSVDIYRYAYCSKTLIIGP